jgi:hypothetical protein
VHECVCQITHSRMEPMARRPNYGGEKRQKELKRQKKREEKEEKKRLRRMTPATEHQGEIPVGETEEAEGDGLEADQGINNDAAGGEGR